jgi:G:T-mismatch repair DNA endonuclease (very short patch repair protein)
MYNIQIQHAENVGEYIIKNTKFSADGYCKETNTIYEFHGDFWHGNPNLYDTNDINKRNDKTFGELYQKTLEREQQIIDYGYNLVVMWEHDWKKINKSIRTLQRKFKQHH